MYFTRQFVFHADLKIRKIEMYFGICEISNKIEHTFSPGSLMTKPCANSNIVNRNESVTPTTNTRKTPPTFASPSSSA